MVFYYQLFIYIGNPRINSSYLVNLYNVVFSSSDYGKLVRGLVLW